MDPQKRILAYFKEGGRLTVNKALYMFSTTELRKIVSRLRQAGHNITSIDDLHALMVETNSPIILLDGDYGDEIEIYDFYRE